METIKHPCVPQTMTPESLSEWIQNQKVDNRNHVEEIPLTEEEIVNLEHTSSLASRSIDKLMEVKKLFDEYLKKGTPFDRATEMHRPMTITIPPTKGINALTANREHADKQIALGHKEEITALYLIPFPEKSRMIMVNITGIEWPEYSRDMTGDEIQQYKPLLRVAKTEEEGTLVVTLGENATIVEGTKQEKKKNRSQRIEEAKSKDEALFPDGEKIVVDELKSDIGGEATPDSDRLPFD